MSGRARMLCLLAATLLNGCAAWRAPATERAFEVSVAWIGDRPAVAWYGGTLAHEALFVRFADARGHWSGPPLQLTDATRNAFEPSLQALDGDLLLAWYEQSAGTASDAPAQVALLARFNTRGQRLWLHQLSAPGVRGRIPVVRVSGGVIHAAWVEQTVDAPPVLRVARLDGQGNRLQPVLDAGEAGATWNLNAAVDADGRLHIVHDRGQDGRKSLHWLIAGATRAEEQPLAQGAGEAVFPDIAIDGTRFVLAWIDSRDGNDELYLRCGELAAASSASAGQPLRAAEPRRVTHTVAQTQGAYTAWRDGVVHVVWIEADAGRARLWHQSFDSGCEPRSGAALVLNAGLEAGIPSLAASRSGLALAWNDLRGRSSRPRLLVWPSVSPSAAAR